MKHDDKQCNSSRNYAKIKCITYYFAIQRGNWIFKGSHHSSPPTPQRLFLRIFLGVTNINIDIKLFGLKGVFSWIGRISKRFLEFYCEKTIIDFLMWFLLKVLLTLGLQNSENLYEKIFTVWPLHPCEHRPSKKSWLIVPTKSQKWLV